MYVYIFKLTYLLDNDISAKKRHTIFFTKKAIPKTLSLRSSKKKFITI